MNDKFEKIGEGILLGIGMVVGAMIISTCLIILTAFVESVLTIF